MPLLGWRWPELLVLLGIGLLCAGAIGGLLRRGFFSPLQRLEEGVVRLARGELQRPVWLDGALAGELVPLALDLEATRRALLGKLRTTTELNLQLESEVARRSAELSRRNLELAETLGRLRLLRDELLRTEKLVAVGRVAATLTSEIVAPVEAMSRLTGPLPREAEALRSVLRSIPEAASARGPEIGQTPDEPGAADASDVTPAADVALGRVASLRETLRQIEEAALRTRDLVRAMRVHTRPTVSDAARDPDGIGAGARLPLQSTGTPPEGQTR